jgi:hypothetical protein
MQRMRLMRTKGKERRNKREERKIKHKLPFNNLWATLKSYKNPLEK